MGVATWQRRLLVSIAAVLVVTSLPLGVLSAASFPTATLARDAVLVANPASDAVAYDTLSPTGAALVVAWDTAETFVGESVTLTLEALDEFGQATKRSGTVLLDIPDLTAQVDGYSGAPVGTSQRFAIALLDGSASVVVRLHTAGQHVALATLADDLETAGESASLQVHDIFFRMQTPATARLTQAQAVVIQAVDAAGQLVRSYGGIVVLESSDAAARIDAASRPDAGNTGSIVYQFNPADQGQVTTQLAFSQRGYQTLAVHDVFNPERRTELSVAVDVSRTGKEPRDGANHAVADQQRKPLGNPGFDVTMSSATANAGVPLTMTVRATDSSGNTNTGYLGQVKFTSTDGAFGPGTTFRYTFVAGDNGVRTFSVTFNTAGAAQTITVIATANAALNGTSPSVAVDETHYVATLAAGTVQQGTAINLTVTAKDSGGNTLTGYRGTVKLSSSWNGVVFPNWGTGVGGNSEYTFTATDVGQHVFTPKFIYAGNQTATVTDKALATRTVTTSTLVVTNSPPTHYPHDSTPSGVKLSDGSLLLAFLGQRGRVYVRRNVGTFTDPAWLDPVLVRIPTASETIGADSPSLVQFGSTIALFHTFTDGTYFQIWLTTSTDDGATWSTPTQITTESGHVQRVQALVDGATLYLFWSRQNTNQQLSYMTTTDLTTWSSVAQVGQTIGVPVGNTTSNFAIVKLASGSWLLGWLERSSVNESGTANNLNYPTVRVATSSNLTTWSSAVELHLPFSQRWPQSVALAQDPASGTIYAAFEQVKAPYDTYLVVRTSTNGTTWAAQTTVGYDRSAPADGTQGYTAAMPALISGSMYCSFTAEASGGAVQGYGHGSWESASSGKGVVNCDLNGSDEPSFLPPGALPPYEDCPTTSCNEAGYPVNTLTGMQSTSATDLSFPAIGLSLTIGRNYNSFDGVAGKSGAFGIGWSWSYGVRAVTLLDGSVLIYDSTGRRLVFWKTGATWTADSFINATLTAGGGGGYVLTRHDQTVWTFDSAGKLTSIADRNGNTTTLTYSSGVIASISAAGGRTLTFTTDGNGRITQIVGPGSLTASYTYDANGHLLTATDPAGSVTTYTYDTRHQMLTVVDGNSHTVETNTYGSLGRVKEQRDADNQLMTFSYGFQGFEGSYTPAIMTDPRGNQTRYLSDAAWRLTQRDAYQGVTMVQRLRWTYDSNGNVTRFTDGRGTHTDYTYDSRGNLLTETVDPGYGGLNLLSTYTYDSMNNPLTYTDPLNHTWTSTYDGDGNLIEVENPLTDSTTFGYDGVGQLTSITDGVSRTTSFGYNGSGDLTTITQPGSIVTSLGYDSAGRLTSITDPLSHVTNMTYNGRGQVTSVTNALSQVTSYGYDTLGNLTSVTDALNEVTTYGYDDLNRLTSVTDALTNVTSYTYDANSNLTRVTDANSHQTNYTYDGINRVLTVADALSNTTTYTWDAANNITQVRDALNVTNRYVFDKANRLTGIDLTNNTSLDITYAYDAASRRTSMVDATGTTSYAYDNADRLTSVSAPTTGTVSYGYNAAGERTSLTYPSTNQVTYAYTSHGQLDTVTDWLSGITDYDYDSAGRLTDISYPNGVSGTLAYDNANRLTDITYVDGLTTLEDISYTLNAVGIRTSMSDLSGTTDWTYDALYRLTEVDYPNSDAISYGYDAVGNRTSLTINGTTTTNTFDNADRMTASGSDSYSYNATGNLTSKTVNSVTTNYTYDALNRLTGISGPTTASYVYDGANRRVSKTVNSVTTTYTWDRLGLGVVIDDGDEYIWGLGLIAQITGSSAETYAHADGLGSIRVLTDDTGASVGTQDYDAFGASRAQSGAQLAFTYTGEQVDAESGLVYLRARYLDPAAGRFQTKDPYPGTLAQPQSLADYTYVRNRPTVLVDPSGLTDYEGQIGPVGGSGSSGGGGGGVPTRIGPAPNFAVTPKGVAIPLPKGSTGPYVTRSPGIEYVGGSGGTGLNYRVCNVRIMDPDYGYKFAHLRNGRVIYTNGSVKPQLVNPRTGMVTTREDGHIPVDMRP